MILFRYILGRVVVVFLMAFVAVLALIALMDAIELLRKSGGRDGVMGAIIAMALLHAPSVTMKALPFVMLLSGMWAYILLARTSEFVAARAAGHSFWAQASAGMTAAFLIGVVAVGLYAPLSAAALNAYERMEARIFDGGGSFLSVSGEGLWLRETTKEGHAVMRAARTNSEGTTLSDTSYFLFGAGDALRVRVDARTAELERGAWALTDAKVYRVRYGPTAPPPETEEHATYSIPTRLTAEEIQNSFAPPESISVWRLPAVISGMEAAGFSARRHIVHFHSMMALPVFLAAMTLIAAAFAIRPPRSAKFGWIALGCALSGFAFYFLSDVTMALGASGAAPPALGAWAPAVGATFLGVAFALVIGEAQVIGFRPRGLGRLLAGTAVAGLLGTPIQAQDLESLGIATPDADTPIVIIADEMNYDTVNRVARAEGNAEAFYGTRAIGADSLVYDAGAGVVSATGAVAVSNDDGSYLFADEAVLGVDLENGTISAPRVLIAGGGRLSAVEGERIDDRYNVLTKAVYSPCDVCEADETPLWRVRADRVVHDEEAHDIIYEDATFDVEGVSVFYLPYFRHPDPTVKRRSGLLTPEFSNDDSIGATAKIPYFFNLAPNRDLTVTPFITTGDGLIMEGEYRARTESGQYRLEGYITYNDVRGDDEFRGALQGEGIFGLENDMYWGYNLDLATDDTFLRRYNYSDVDRVTSRLYFGRETDTLFAEANLLYFQSFRVDESSETIPQALPEFRLHNRFLEDQQFGIANISASAVRLERERGRDYNRFSADLNWERPFLTDLGLAITPFAQGQVDGYLIEHDATFDSDVQGRATVSGGVDVRMPFIAENELGVHVIEPIVQAVIAPNTNDTLDIPNEDSLDIEFDETNLFAAGSRFPGQDRFEGGTRFNTGVRYDFRSESGLEFEAVYGRVFRLRDNPDFSEASGLRDTESDHVTSLRLSLPPYFDITHRMRLESGNISMRRNEVYSTLNYDRFSAELDYVFVEADPLAGFPEDREDIYGALGVKLDENWSAFASSRHDLEDSRFINVRGGLSYENECCALDFTVKRRFNDDRDADESTNFGLRVRLKTLGGQVFGGCLIYGPFGWQIPRPASRSCGNGKTRRNDMTHRWGLGKLGAACVALLLAALPVTASAQTFAPVAVVNDQIITTFDLDQRMRLMRAAGSQAGEAALREAAIEELINDRLRMQAARRAGVVPTSEQIQSGFDEISRQNGRDPEEMRRYFTTQGVTQEALAGQIGPEVAWRQLIRQRYMPRMRVSDAEIGDIINSARAGSEAQYLLTEIRMPVDQNGEGAALQKARGILQELVQSGEFAETARRYSNGPTASLGGDLGWVSASAISPTALDVVSKMSADRVSAPFVDGSDVVIYGLRGIRNAGAIAPSKYRLAQLVVGVAPDAPQTEADAAFQRAIAARSQVSDCASVDALREGYLPISGDLGELSFSEMPGPVRQAVGGLEVGEISQPIRSNDGFHIIVVCGKTEITGEDAARNERAREALISRKLARYARAYLKELRREAVIEMR